MTNTKILMRQLVTVSSGFVLFAKYLYWSVGMKG